MTGLSAIDAAGLDACRAWCDAEASCFAIQWVPGDDWCDGCTGWDNSQGVYSMSSWAATSGDAEVQTKECWQSSKYWGNGNGWCMSGLDELIGMTSDANACWTMCEDEYGSGLVAIDWSADNGECYCQNDCQCMEDLQDAGTYLVTRDYFAALPDKCPGYALSLIHI